MGSLLSGIIQKVTGIPPIDFRKKGSPVKDTLIGAIVEQLAVDQAAELLRKLPDDALAVLLRAAKDETKRRLDSD